MPTTVRHGRSSTSLNEIVAVLEIVVV